MFILSSPAGKNFPGAHRRSTYSVVHQRLTPHCSSQPTRQSADSKRPEVTPSTNSRHTGMSKTVELNHVVTPCSPHYRHIAHSRYQESSRIAAASPRACHSSRALPIKSRNILLSEVCFGSRQASYTREESEPHRVELIHAGRRPPCTPSTRPTSPWRSSDTETPSDTTCRKIVLRKGKSHGRRR